MDLPAVHTFSGSSKRVRSLTEVTEDFLRAPTVSDRIAILQHPLLAAFVFVNGNILDILHFPELHPNGFITGILDTSENKRVVSFEAKSFFKDCLLWVPESVVSGPISAVIHVGLPLTDHAAGIVFLGVDASEADIATFINSPRPENLPPSVPGDQACTIGIPRIFPLFQDHAMQRGPLNEFPLPRMSKNSAMQCWIKTNQKGFPVVKSFTNLPGFPYALWSSEDSNYPSCTCNPFLRYVVHPLEDAFSKQVLAKAYPTPLPFPPLLAATNADDFYSSKNSNKATNDVEQDYNNVVNDDKLSILLTSGDTSHACSIDRENEISQSLMSPRPTVILPMKQEETTYENTFVDSISVNNRRVHIKQECEEGNSDSCSETLKDSAMAMNADSHRVGNQDATVDSSLLTPCPSLLHDTVVSTMSATVTDSSTKRSPLPYEIRHSTVSSNAEDDVDASPTHSEIPSTKMVSTNVPVHSDHESHRTRSTLPTLSHLPAPPAGDYDVTLPITSEGLLLHLAEVHQAATFLGYRSFADGSKGQAEIENRIKKGDVIVAVNGVTVMDRSFQETIRLLRQLDKRKRFMQIRFRSSESLSNSHSLSTVASSLQPMNTDMNVSPSAMNMDQPLESNDQFFMCVKGLIKYLKIKNPSLHQEAVAVLKECLHRHDMGVSNCKSSREILLCRLKTLVGDSVWRMAASHWNELLKVRNTHHDETLTIVGNTHTSITESNDKTNERSSARPVMDDSISKSTSTEGIVPSTLTCDKPMQTSESYLVRNVFSNNTSTDSAPNASTPDKVFDHIVSVILNFDTEGKDMLNKNRIRTFTQLVALGRDLRIFNQLFPNVDGFTLDLKRFCMWAYTNEHTPTLRILAMDQNSFASISIDKIYHDRRKKRKLSALSLQS